MGWRDEIAKRLASVGADYKPRTDLPTRAYHGTDRVFPAFENREAGFMLDRAIGTHVAKDPALASSFADRHIVPGDMWHPELRIMGSPHVYPLRIPAEKFFLQADQPQVLSNAFKAPLWKKVMSDENSIERMAAEAAFTRDPDLLARYLHQTRGIPRSDTVPMSRSLVAGESVPIHEGTYDLPGIIRNWGGKPVNTPDRQTMVDLARQHWEGQGYKGIRYINTAPSEAGAPGVKDPTSYIVFDPKNIRSEFAGFDPAQTGSSNLLAGVAGAAAVPGLGALAVQDQYPQELRDAAQ